MQWFVTANSFCTTCQKESLPSLVSLLVKSWTSGMFMQQNATLVSGAHCPGWQACAVLRTSLQVCLENGSRYEERSRALTRSQGHTQTEQGWQASLLSSARVEGLCYSCLSQIRKAGIMTVHSWHLSGLETQAPVCS